MIAADGLERDVGERVHGDRLRAIRPVAEDGEHRQPPQKIRDVVDQDVAGAHDERGPENRVVDPGLPDGRFDRHS